LATPSCPQGDSVETRLPVFHARAADQAHAASMPGTAWPVIGHPPDSSRSPRPGHGSDAISFVTTRQQRFGFTHLPGPHLTPHWCLFHIAHHDGLQPTQHVVVWSLPPKGDSEGPTFISRTASTPGGLPTCASGPPFVVHGTRPGKVAICLVRTIGRVGPVSSGRPLGVCRRESDWRPTRTFRSFAEALLATASR